jgi:hypothetical protein
MINCAMNDRSKQSIKVVLLVALLCLSTTARPQTIAGKVVGVSDGDEAQAAGYRKARNCPR